MHSLQLSVPSKCTKELVKSWVFPSLYRFQESKVEDN